MKPEELRIGNLVYPRYMKSEGREHSITGQDIAKIEAGVYYFTPIPLTEEWLKKFGFEKQMAWTYCITVGTEKLVIYLGQKGWSLGNKMNPDFYNLKYVHQLQNLYFALTVEELEINE